MANIPLSVPFQFRRTSNVPLDYTSVVSTTTELNGLSSAATSYLGMQVFNAQDQTLYVLITSGENSLPHFYALGGNNSSAASGATTQLQTVSSTLHNEVTTLSSNVFGAVGEALAQQISALSAFDTITELAAAVDSLSTYKTNSNFLSASSPTITTGDLTLANGFGIKMSGGTTVIDSSRNVIANALYVGIDNNVYPKIITDGVYAAAEVYVKADGAAKVGGLTATSLELGNGAITNAGAIGAQSVTVSGAIQGASLSASGLVSGNDLSVTAGLTAGSSNFKVSNAGAITNVAGITSQGAIDAGSSKISTTGTVEAGTLSASGSVYGKNLTLSEGITSSNSKFTVDGSGNVTVGVIGGAEANLTVTGNLSVLGTTTYLDTEVKTMSAVVAELNSNTATTLAVKQTGTYEIATFENSSGVQLKVSNNGSLSAAQAATFANTVTVGGKLTVSADISSSQTVYASAGKFTDLLEVGSAATSVLYVEPSGVGIDTETLNGYSLNISSGGGYGGTMYVGGSANFAAQANIVNADSTISSGGAITNGSRIVNVTTMWQFISALDGGSF